MPFRIQRVLLYHLSLMWTIYYCDFGLVRAEVQNSSCYQLYNCVMQVLMACLRRRTTIEPWLAHLKELVHALKSYLVVSVILFSLETYLVQQEIRMPKLLYSQSGFNCVVCCYRLVFFSFLSTSKITCKLVLPGFSKWCHNYQKLVSCFDGFWLHHVLMIISKLLLVPTIKAENNSLSCLFPAKMVVVQGNFLDFASVSESQLRPPWNAGILTVHCVFSVTMNWFVCWTVV